MTHEHLRPVAFDEAVRMHEAQRASNIPRTLHPAYVRADAARDAQLAPVYLCFESQGERWCHNTHTTQVPGMALKDASSPYGYGGPVATTSDADFIGDAWRAYRDWMREEHIVVEYVRFHPLMCNEQWYLGQVVDNRAVVSVDLMVSDVEENYEARLRGTLRKAARAELYYEEIPLDRCYELFGDFHRAAMRDMGTDAFFHFDDLYFEALAKTPGTVVGVCRPDPGEPWLAAGLFLDGNGIREYHLAAATEAGRKVGASSWVLHLAALRARAAGQQQLYLGGGSTTHPDNPLLFFKSGFSRARLPYKTGWTVFDTAAYHELKARFPAQWQAHPERPIFHRKV